MSTAGSSKQLTQLGKSGDGSESTPPTCRFRPSLAIFTCFCVTDQDLMDLCLLWLSWAGNLGSKFQIMCRNIVWNWSQSKFLQYYQQSKDWVPVWPGSYQAEMKDELIYPNKPNRNLFTIIIYLVLSVRMFAWDAAEGWIERKSSQGSSGFILTVFLFNLWTSVWKSSDLIW